MSNTCSLLVSFLFTQTEPAVTTPAATPAPIIPEPTTPAPTICEGRNFYRDDDTGKCSNEVTGGTYGKLLLLYEQGV